MARHNRTSAADDRIIVARLDGSARRLLDGKTPGEEAVAELHEITRDPRLLAIAGGTALGAWLADQVRAHDGRDVARLLTHAGADEQLLQEVADDVAARMPHRHAHGS